MWKVNLFLTRHLFHQQHGYQMLIDFHSLLQHKLQNYHLNEKFCPGECIDWTSLFLVQGFCLRVFSMDNLHL